MDKTDRQFWEKRGRYWFLRLPKFWKEWGWFIVHYRTLRRNKYGRCSRSAAAKIAWNIRRGLKQGQRELAKEGR